MMFKSVMDEHFNFDFAALTNICIVKKYRQKKVQKFELIST